MKVWQVFFVMLICWACSSKESLTKEELEKYFVDEDNGLVQRVDKGDVKLTMYYKPKDLVWRQQVNGLTDAVEKEKIKSSMASLDYFILQLSKNGKEIENSYVSDPEEFNRAVNYLGFYMAEDLKMICGRDTIPVFDVVYVRGFGMSESTNVMAIFKSNLLRHTGNIRIRFDDTRFGTGLSEFKFDAKNIKNIPELKPE